MSGHSQTIACPKCDTLHRVDDAIATRDTRCIRCGHRLTYGRTGAIVRVVGLAMTSAILLALAMFLPFLNLSSGGRTVSSSLVEVVAGFAHGIMVPLALAVLGFILVLPLTRLLLLVFALGPVALGRHAVPGASTALRWAFLLKPWAMAEIFMVGVAVALVKLAGLASIGMGAAFWVLAAVVLLSAYQETFMCRHTLWTELNEASQ
ncbi:MAG: paraquat-inducible protein A [Maritimibacter sp.]|nr:paraquat-inducible protein A [Maritimibacter sp.]